MKYFLTIIVLLLVLLLLILFIFEMEEHNDGINNNSLSVSVASSIDKYKIRIEQGSFTINRESDREIFIKKTDVLYMNGSELKTIENGYGENDFLVTYADSLYLQFRHLKTRGIQKEAYNFHFFMQDSNILVKFEVDGTNPMKFTHAMNPIADADSLRCNAPINDDAILYNMLELVEPKQ